MTADKTVTLQTAYAILERRMFPDMETAQAVAAACVAHGFRREAEGLNAIALRLAGERARLHAYNVAAGRPDTPTED